MRFAFVVPEEDLRQVIASKVIVVTRNVATRLRVQETHNLAAFDHGDVLIVLPVAERPNCEVRFVRGCVYFVEGSKLVGQHSSVDIRVDDILKVFVSSYDVRFGSADWLDTFSCRNVQVLLGLVVFKHDHVAVVNWLAFVSVPVAGFDDPTHTLVALLVQSHHVARLVDFSAVL